MRILQVLSGNAFHGAEAMTAELIRQLHRLGVSVDIAVFDNAAPGNAEVFDAVGTAAAATFHIPCAGQLDLTALRELNRIVADRHISIIHSHKYKTNFYGALTRAIKPVKLLSTYHNWLYQTPALRLYAAVDKRLARFSDLCVAVSKPVADELRRHVSAPKVLQIDNGIDTDVYRPSAGRADAKSVLGLSPERALIGFVGRLSAEKGLPCLIEALAGLATRNFDAIIVGDGELRSDLEMQVSALGLAGRVTFLGARRDVHRIYQAIDIFVLPSTEEAFPMVLLEAMASGCAVIATAVGEVERIVEIGESGLIVAPTKPEAICQAIDCLLLDARMRQRLGQAARERVITSFSSRSMATAYLRSYERLDSM